MYKKKSLEAHIGYRYFSSAVEFEVGSRDGLTKIRRKRLMRTVPCKSVHRSPLSLLIPGVKPQEPKLVPVLTRAKHTFTDVRHAEARHPAFAGFRPAH